MKFKVFIISVLFICAMLPELILAQNKMVVIPLISDCNAIQTVTSAAGRVWMDRNLGASKVAESVTDHGAYGWLYQWGRLTDGHEQRFSPTEVSQSSDDVPGHGNFIISHIDWRSEPNHNLWQGKSGTNNPCPKGFRLPTKAEWETEIASWSSNSYEGAFASPLKLVVTGRRIPSDGRVTPGNAGFYWSSTVDPVDDDEAYYLYLGSDGAYMSDWFRAEGFSVRCIKD